MKSCRICYEEDGVLYEPCKCKGTIAYAHKECIERIKSNLCMVCKSKFNGITPAAENASHPKGQLLFWEVPVQEPLPRRAIRRGEYIWQLPEREPPRERLFDDFLIQGNMVHDPQQDVERNREIQAALRGLMEFKHPPAGWIQDIQ
jgi:hypothetical protein